MLHSHWFCLHHPSRLFLFPISSKVANKLYVCDLSSITSTLGTSGVSSGHYSLAYSYNKIRAAVLVPKEWSYQKFTPLRGFYLCEQIRLISYKFASQVPSGGETKEKKKKGDEGPDEQTQNDSTMRRLLRPQRGRSKLGRGSLVWVSLI